MARPRRYDLSRPSNPRGSDEEFLSRRFSPSPTPGVIEVWAVSCRDKTHARQGAPTRMGREEPRHYRSIALVKAVATQGQNLGERVCLGHPAAQCPAIAGQAPRSVPHSRQNLPRLAIPQRSRPRVPRPPKALAQARSAGQASARWDSSRDMAESASSAATPADSAPGCTMRRDSRRGPGQPPPSVPQPPCGWPLDAHRASPCPPHLEEVPEDSRYHLGHVHAGKAHESTGSVSAAHVASPCAEAEFAAAMPGVSRDRRSGAHDGLLVFRVCCHGVSPRPRSILRTSTRHFRGEDARRARPRPRCAPRWQNSARPSRRCARRLAVGRRSSLRAQGGNHVAREGSSTLPQISCRRAGSATRRRTRRCSARRRPCQRPMFVDHAEGARGIRGCPYDLFGVEVIDALVKSGVSAKREAPANVFGERVEALHKASREDGGRRES